MLNACTDEVAVEKSERGGVCKRLVRIDAADDVPTVAVRGLVGVMVGVVPARDWAFCDGVMTCCETGIAWDIG